VDVFTRENVAIESGQSLRGGDVVRTLNKLKHEGRVPKLLPSLIKSIKSLNSSINASKRMSQAQP
jgi:hypothetical protein